jgi:hypothetical protein
MSPISSMCPAIASTGPSPDPRTRATVEPTVSDVTSSANAAHASRKTAAGACS